MKFVLLFISLLFNSSFAAELKEFHSWENNGPGGLEHSANWTHENNYYLTHGYAYQPFQGIQSTKLWSLDLSTKIWSELPVKGDIPTDSGRAAKRGKLNQILMLSNENIMFGRRQISTLNLLTIVDGVGTWKRLELAATNQKQQEGARAFLLRDSSLSSIIYNSNDDSFYSICATENCEVFKINIFGDNATVEVLDIEGEKPNARIGFAFGMSQKNNQFVLFSGQNTAENSTEFFSAEIWIFDFKTKNWSIKPTPFSGRRNPCYAFNESKQEFYIWGGTTDGSSSIDGLEVFNLESLSFQSSPDLTRKSRASCFGTYDDLNKRVLFGFGNFEEIYTDLWTIID